MTPTQEIKKILVRKIKELPEYKLREVLAFVNFILSTETDYSIFMKKKNKMTSNKQALMKFIGGVSHGTLAQEIDKELYGT